jgi:hypothetical protein
MGAEIQSGRWYSTDDRMVAKQDEHFSGQFLPKTVEMKLKRSYGVEILVGFAIRNALPDDRGPILGISRIRKQRANGTVV